MDTKQRVALEIDGMSCQKCVAHVKAALEDVKGVEVRSVTVGSAEVDVNPSVVQNDDLLEAVGEAGYEARVVRQ